MVNKLSSDFGRAFFTVSLQILSNAGASLLFDVIWIARLGNSTWLRLARLVTSYVAYPRKTCVHSLCFQFCRREPRNSNNVAADNTPSSECHSFSIGFIVMPKVPLKESLCHHCESANISARLNICVENTTIYVQSSLVV
jgi:hypothetical protein